MLIEDSNPADADADTDCLLESWTIKLLEMMVLDDGHLIGSNQCMSLPKTELKTKNSTKRQLCCRLVEFLVFNSIHWKISVQSDGRNRIVVHLLKIFLI